MSEPRNVTLQIGRGGGLSLRVNDSYVSHTMESLVVSELSISAAILETLGPIPPRRAGLSLDMSILLMCGVGVAENCLSSWVTPSRIGTVERAGRHLSSVRGSWPASADTSPGGHDRDAAL